MFDAAAIRFERAAGEAAVSLGPGARLRGLRQKGAAKAFLPRIDRPVPEIVFLNTAGGLTGGDRLSYAVTLDADAAVATTQTAERAYRVAQGTAEVNVALSLGPGAQLDWLPQETILYDRAALNRRTRADMAGDAVLVLAEMVVLGRAAMGESVRGLALRDRREVWRAGAPCLIDTLHLDDEGLAPRPALLGGARAVATVALIAPGAEEALGPLRAALPPEAAASAWDGKCVARLAMSDGLALKRAVARALHILRRGAPLPRVWQI